MNKTDQNIKHKPWIKADCSQKYISIFVFKRSTLLGIFLLLSIYVFTFVADVLASISYCAHKSEQTNIPQSNQYMLIV